MPQFEHMVIYRQVIGHSAEEQSVLWFSSGEELCEDFELQPTLSELGKHGFHLVGVTETRLYMVRIVLAEPTQEEPKPQAPRYIGAKDDQCESEFTSSQGLAFLCQLPTNHPGNHWALGIAWDNEGNQLCGSVVSNPVNDGVLYCKRSAGHEGNHLADIPTLNEEELPYRW